MQNSQTHTSSLHQLTMHTTGLFKKLLSRSSSDQLLALSGVVWWSNQADSYFRIPSGLCSLCSCFTRDKVNFPKNTIFRNLSHLFCVSSHLPLKSCIALRFGICHQQYKRYSVYELQTKPDLGWWFEPWHNAQLNSVLFKSCSKWKITVVFLWFCLSHEAALCIVLHRQSLIIGKYACKKTWWDSWWVRG